jgi:hypothetical protein
VKSLFLDLGSTLFCFLRKMVFLAEEFRKNEKNKYNMASVVGSSYVS